jgi:ABC-type sugar transport system ATPase subunit
VLAADRLLVLSSVDATEAMLLGGGVHVVDAGAVLQRGTPRSVSAGPISQRVAELVHVPALGTWGFRLAIEPEVGPVALFGAWQAVPAPPSFADLGPGEYRIGVPAHGVRTERTDRDDMAVHCVVRSLECLGAEALLRAEHEGGELAVLVARDHRWAPRQALDLYFALRDAFVFTPAGRTMLAPATEASSHAAS